MPPPKEIKTDAKLTARVQLYIPAIPDFILTPGGRSIDIKDLPDSTLRELGRRWLDKLISRAQERRG